MLCKLLGKLVFQCDCEVKIAVKTLKKSPFLLLNQAQSYFYATFSIVVIVVEFHCEIRYKIIGNYLLLDSSSDIKELFENFNKSFKSSPVQIFVPVSIVVIVVNFIVKFTLKLKEPTYS